MYSNKSAMARFFAGISGHGTISQVEVFSNPALGIVIGAVFLLLDGFALVLVNLVCIAFFHTIGPAWRLDRSGFCDIWTSEATGFVASKWVARV